jgi:tRNA nucleotidyltransferase (CCA-adding enzyme)
VDFSPTVPEAVRWITTTLEDAGFETWVVGGAIRDLLLGHPAGDWDLATRARPEEIMATFSRTVPIGVDHGTVGVLAGGGTLYEVTTFRRDVETFGRHAVVEFADNIEEDLARRDFTFNAIAWHPLRGELLDPTEGLGDLEAKVVRTVGPPAERFAEDFLRVLRALRFSGQFGFVIEEDTWRALCDAVPELHVLSAERVQEELMKVLSQADRPSMALQLYARSGALAELYPELVRAVATPGGPSLDEVLTASDAVPRTRPLVRLATLLSPLAGDGSRDARDAYATVEGLLGRLRCSKADTKRVSTLVANRTLGVPSRASTDIRRWLNRTDPALFPDLARIWLAEVRAGLDPVGGAGSDSDSDAAPTELVVRRIKAIRAVLGTQPPLSVSDLALNGDHLQAMGLRPGPRFGEIFERLLEHVLDHPEANTPSELETLVSEMGLKVEASEPSTEDQEVHE